MSIWAYSQENDAIKQSIEPFDDKDGQESFLPAMVSVDPDNNRIYAMNTGTGQFAGIRLDSDAPDLLALEWMVAQASYSYTSLVDPGDRRVIVASDIPKLDLPGSTYTTPYETEQVVWRAAEDGRELARSPLLPAMSQGAALSPGTGGAIYYPAASGHVIEVSVQ